jgi:predicted Zn-dependent protease
MYIRSIVVLGVALALVPGVFGAKKTAEEKAAETRDKEKKTAAKNEQTYEKLKQFSLDLYANDTDFKDAADRDFDLVQQQHSEDAFRRNVSRRSQTVAIHEDRFRSYDYGALYDNLVIQDYVNRIGQRLVPDDSEKLFAFRLVAHPIPFAETLSTGTIYVSTGLVALLDNEAQLSYVLGHEMAHVYKDHWRLKSMMKLGEPEYNKKQETKRAWWGLIGVAAGAATGAAIGRDAQSAGIGALVGGVGGYIAGAVINRGMNLDWDKVQEDEADQVAFKAALKCNYDVKEVPKLYASLQNSAAKDNRVALGFIGSRKRVRERLENAKDLIGNAYKADLEAKEKAGVLIGDNPDYRHLMAELKRDNGIMAYYYDMFDLAKKNLSEAVSIRSNDPTANYFYGKVLELVARTPEETKLAEQSFVSAAKYDKRHQNFGSHLHLALALMGEKNEANQAQVIEELKSYVDGYLTFSISNARSTALLPPNLDTIYDYLTLTGEDSWMPTVPENAPLVYGGDSPDLQPASLTPVGTSAPSVAVPASQPQPAPPAKKGLIPLPLPLRKK